jgi:hypothetical protein
MSKVWRASLVALAAFAVLYVMVKSAGAHDWYSWRCCHDRDCRELPDGAVRETAHGYVVTIPGRPEPVVIGYGDTRVEVVPVEHDDGRTFHICTVAGEAGTSVLCLYTPGRGV